jgi:sialic acid synthase SpsE
MKNLKKTAAETGRVKIIAEIGTSHNGSLAQARDLIEAAAQAGTDILKTQIVFADEIIHPNTGDVALPGGNIKLFDRFRDLEKDLDFYRRLKEITESYGMIFLASPFGLKSLDYLIKLNCDWIKIASPELNHFPLLKASAGTGKKMLLSTGVSMLTDIENALKITGRENTVLFHCITSYPAPENEYNLKLIPLFKSIFGTAVGVSDHSMDPVLIPAVAVAVGAEYIEKHFTMSTSGDGLDDPIALSPSHFSSMIKMIRRTEKAEEPLEMLRAELGTARMDAALGDGIKKLAASEEMNYGLTNRSVHALKNLEAGDIITSENTALLRTEKKLRPGLRPEFYNSILGKKLKNPIDAGQGIIQDDIS